MKLYFYENAKINEKHSDDDEKPVLIDSLMAFKWQLNGCI
jgi:hypothetical protein